MNRFLKEVKKSNIDGTYTGFEFHPARIVRYLKSAGTFTLLLDNGEIVHFEPDDIHAFSDWLTLHRVSSILRPK